MSEAPRSLARVAFGRVLHARFWTAVFAAVAVGALAVALLADWKQALQAPRTVVVRVVDVAGEPVRGAQVFAPTPEGNRRPATEFEPGQHSLTGLAEESVEIVAEVSGNRYHIQHPTKKTSATIVLPSGGRVIVDWSFPPDLDLQSGRVMLVFEPQAAPTDRFEVPVPPRPHNRGSLLVPYVLPGVYLAQLERWREPKETSEKTVVLPLTSPLEVTVEARKLTRVALGKSAP